MNLKIFPKYASYLIKNQPANDILKSYFAIKSTILECPGTLLNMNQESLHFLDMLEIPI